MDNKFKSGDVDIRIAVGSFKCTVKSVSNAQLGYSMASHCHGQNIFEMHFITQGSGTLIADDVRYDISPMSLFMTGEDVWHEQIIDLKEKMTEFCVRFEAGEPNSSVGEIFTSTRFWIGKDDGSVYAAMEKIAAELATRRVGYIDMVKNALENIVITLVRAYRESAPSQEEFTPLSLDDRRIRIAEDMFMWNYRDLTVAKLAEALGLSVRQCERELKRYFGCSFGKKLLAARMSAAAKRLKTMQMSIGDIADRCGFESREYFCRVFKSYYGITASEMRRGKQIK